MLQTVEPNPDRDWSTAGVSIPKLVILWLVALWPGLPQYEFERAGYVGFAGVILAEENEGLALWQVDCDWAPNGPIAGNLDAGYTWQISHLALSLARVTQAAIPEAHE